MAGELLRGAAPFSASNGSSGALVLHGFTGSPFEMRSLAEAFADAGFSVELPLHPGHGTAPRDLVPMRFSDWAEAAEATYLSISARCDRTVVAGLSMGGTLACWLAERHRDIAGVVLINPLIAPPPPEVLDELRKGLAAGAIYAPGGSSDIHREVERPDRYEQVPLAPLLSLLEATEQVASHLEEIDCPVLLLSSRDDHVVPPESADLLQAAVSGPVERVVLESSYHVATLDYDAGEIEHRTVAFAQKVACR